MRYGKWIAALAVFLLLGYVLGLGAFGWSVYSLMAVGVLNRYRDMQARLAAGETDAALFTQEEMQEAYDRSDRAYEDTTDWTIYPAGSRELQWIAFHDGKDIHPDDCRPLY